MNKIIDRLKWGTIKTGAPVRNGDKLTVTLSYTPPLWLRLLDKVLLPVRFVRAVVGWLRAPEPREPYDIDAEVDLHPLPLVTEPDGTTRPLGAGHVALYSDVPIKPNSLRAFAYCKTAEGLFLYFDPAYEGQAPRMRNHNGTPLYI